MSARRAIFSLDAALLGCRFIPQPTLGPATPIGVIPPSGSLQTQVPARTLPAADETGTFVIQALFVPPSGAARLSNATAIALVDVAISLN